MSVNIEPLGARVLIRPGEGEDKTASGLYLPETAKEKPQQGTVEALGAAGDMTTDLKVGDVVIFPKYSGTEIKIGGVAYLLLDEGDVLARVTA